MIKDSIKKEIIIITFLFLSSLYFGYYVASQYPNLAYIVFDEISSQFRFVKVLPSYLLFFFIFINNSIKILLAMLLGVMFGLVPLLFILLNAFIIGVVLYVSSMKIGMWSSIMLILPHGIIEIPALILGCSYGLWLGKKLILKIIGKNVSMTDCIKYSITQYVKFIMPMLMIAALIETYITPLISSLISKLLIYFIILL